MTPQQKAFLDMIAVSEGTANIGIGGYDVLVGSTPRRPLLFRSYATHPHIYNKALNSTAAGRYQIIFRTWVNLQKKLGLPDFSPSSQDAAALELVNECRALDDIEAGKLADAVQKCAHIWASFPGAGANQHENSLDALARAFTDAGGVVTA